MIKNIGLVLVLLIGLGAGFWFGQHNQSSSGSDKSAIKERKLLYYRHPMNPQVTSPEPAKESCFIILN